MTSSHSTNAAPRERRLRVLHVTECFLGGTRSAILSYVHGTPEIDHALLGTVGRSHGELDAPEGLFSHLQVLPDGHLSRIMAIRSLVDSWHPDIIHAHSSYAGIYVRIAVRNGPHRSVIYTPHAYAFERLDINPAKRALIHAVEGVLTRNTGVVAACSTRERKLAQRMHANRAVFVPNVAAPQFHTHDAVMPLPAHRVVTVIGRVVPQRDPEFICAVADELFRRDDQTTVQWIGDGDSAAMTSLRRHGIDVTGWLNATEITTRLAESSVYLHPGRWEGFPIAILEAHGMGLPIIARDASYLEDAPIEIRGSDPSQIAKNLVTLASNDAARRANYELWATYLASNSDAAQRAALLDAYAYNPQDATPFSQPHEGAS
ncbi:MAG: glycosyltransferase [Cutibacterium avidum]|nr:glycosyltransferase [Cutibacterium avidum]